MALKEAFIKPITNEKAIHNIKKALSKSSVDKEAIRKAKKQLKDYGFDSK